MPGEWFKNVTWTTGAAVIGQEHCQSSQKRLSGVPAKTPSGFDANAPGGSGSLLYSRGNSHTLKNKWRLNWDKNIIGYGLEDFCIHSAVSGWVFLEKKNAFLCTLPICHTCLRTFRPRNLFMQVTCLLWFERGKKTLKNNQILICFWLFFHASSNSFGLLKWFVRLVSVILLWSLGYFRDHWVQAFVWTL